jgi:adapter protein MecA 1/2
MKIRKYSYILCMFAAMVGIMTACASDEQEEMYLLALARSDHSAADFNRICNMLSEYGALERASGATFAFLEEHCKTFLSGDAVQQLANI